MTALARERTVTPPSAKTGEGETHTYGWDTAFAIPVSQVNKAIVDHNSSPPDFAQTESGFDVSSTFDAWQLTSGGDGKNVRMALSLRNVVLTNKSNGTVLHYDGGTALVEVMLHYIPHTDAATGPADTVPHALVVKDSPDEEGAPVAAVLDLTLTPKPGEIAHAVIQAALGRWLNDHLSEFRHVFAVVNLNTMIDQGEWAFVKPHYASYAYLDRETVDNSVFAVLCMTGDRSGHHLAEQVAPNAIPDGCVAGFLISQRRIMADLVKPAIRLAYPGLTEDNFKLSADGTELYLTKGTTVDLQAVHPDSGGTYYPKLTKLTVRAAGETLTVNSYTETEVVSGITANCESTHWYTMSLGTSKHGQTINFTPTQNPSIVHNISQSEGSRLTQEIIAITAAIALVILTVVTDGADLIVGGLVLGLLIGADLLVPALIEKLNTDDSPAIDLVLANMVGSITWTGSQAFRLDRVGLHGALQLGGDPRFV